MVPVNRNGRGAIVAIPGMPGERIDRRILSDVLDLIGRFKVRVTDGYAPTGHAANGEHPVGLAVDVVPDTARGGTWADVDHLAAFAAQHPSVFRFVGYDGRFGTTKWPGHGPPSAAGANAHLHLSWHGRDGKPILLESNGTLIDQIGDVPGDIAGAVGGAASDAAGAVAGAAGDAAGDLAGAVASKALGLLVDVIGEKGTRAALWLALVGAGVLAVLVGTARLAGVRADDVKNAAVTVATRNPDAAAAAA
jgi:hypothetical protein